MSRYLAFAIALFALPASAAVLLPGEVLILEFRTDPALFTLPPDLLWMNINSTGRLDPPAPLSTITSQLFDGDTLLGTFHLPDAQPTVGEFLGLGASIFLSTEVPTAYYTGGTPVDFTSILDGTIQGRYEVTIPSGSLVIDDLSGVFALTAQASEDGWMGVPGFIGSPAIIVPVPEPSTVLLVALGLGAMAIRRAARVETKSVHRAPVLGGGATVRVAIDVRMSTEPDPLVAWGLYSRARGIIGNTS